MGGQQPPCIVPPQFAVRTQELSRDMMQAATIAETNLRLVSIHNSLALFLIPKLFKTPTKQR